jgi:CRP/FNR family transcriptional regulator
VKRIADKIYCSACGGYKVSPFCNYNGDALASIENNKHCIQYKKGEVIFQEGSYPHGVHCINQGKVKLFKAGVEGREQIIRFAKAGDLVGYRALLSGEPYSSSAGCLEDVTVCFIPKEVLMAFIHDQPDFSMILMRRACHELGEAARIITNMAQKSTRERLAEMLLLLNHTFGTDADGALDVRLTREELASLVGTATESLIRLLADFKEEGLIGTENKKIFLKNIAGLVKAGKVEDVM